MILFEDSVKFKFFDKEMVLYSSETEYGLSTVADMGDWFYYIGNEKPTLETAMFIWQDAYNVTFSDDDFAQIVDDNIKL